MLGRGHRTTAQYSSSYCITEILTADEFSVLMRNVGPEKSSIYEESYLNAYQKLVRRLDIPTFRPDSNAPTHSDLVSRTFFSCDNRRFIGKLFSGADMKPGTTFCLEPRCFVENNLIDLEFHRLVMKIPLCYPRITFLIEKRHHLIFLFELFLNLPANLY